MLASWSVLKYRLINCAYIVIKWKKWIEYPEYVNSIEPYVIWNRPENIFTNIQQSFFLNFLAYETPKKFLEMWQSILLIPEW